MNQKDRLIFALDAPGLDAAREWVNKLKDVVGVFKVGSQLYTREGPAAVKLVNDMGGQVFLDLKFHDIPFTVGEAAAEAAAMGVHMFTVHAQGGKAMLRSAVNWSREAAEKNGKKPPIVLAVTVLTSLTDQDLEDIGILYNTMDQSIRMANLAKEAGVHGVIASPLEVKALRKDLGREFLIVTPGIRMSAAGADDQKRTMTPGEAIKAGADYLVVGRPIREAPDPVAAAKTILKEMG